MKKLSPLYLLVIFAWISMACGLFTTPVKPTAAPTSTPGLAASATAAPTVTTAVKGKTVPQPGISQPRTNPSSSEGSPQQASPTRPPTATVPPKPAEGQVPWDLISLNNGKMTYQDGVLRMSVNTPQTFTWCTYRSDANLADVNLSMNVTAEKATGQGNFGFLCRVQDDNNFYVLQVREDRFFNISKLQNGKWYSLYDWASSNNIPAGSTMTLQASCNGSHLTLGVNDKKLVEVDDNTFTTGGVGVAIGTLDKGGIQLAFSNFQTLTPNQASPSTLSGLIAEDDFSQDNGQWSNIGQSDAGSIFYRYAELFFTVDEANYYFPSEFSTGKNVDNVLITTEAQLIKSSGSGSFGFMCRISSNTDFYLLLVSEDSLYSIIKVQNGDWTPLVDWTYSLDIPESGEMVTLQARCDGPNLALGVNDVWLDEVTDTSLPSGGIGLVANNYDNPGFGVSFDNFKVYAPSTEVSVPTSSVPSATPTAEALSSGVLAQDNFSQDNGQWSTFSLASDSVAFHSGELWITENQKNYVAWSNFNSQKDLSNVTLSVDVRMEKSTGSGAFGFLCRYKDDSNYYALRVSEDRQFSIYKRENDILTALQKWTSSTDIPDGQPMTVQARCDGSKLAVGVNGKWLAEITDSTFSTGKVGLMAAAYDNPGVIVAFDNFKALAPGASSSSGLLAQDDFNQDSGLWRKYSGADGSISFQDGKMLITADQASMLFYSTFLADKNLSDAEISVDVQQVKTTGTGMFGILCRIKNGDNYYLLRIQENRSFSIIKKENGQWNTLKDWEKSNDIPPAGQAMTLTARCAGNKLSLGVNDKLLAEVTDSTFSSGQIALMAGTYDNPGVAVVFDNFKAYQP